MEIDELLLDRAIKAFHMSIHLWGARVGMPMRHLGLAHVIGEVFSKFTTVIGEDHRARDGKHALR